MDGHIDDVFKAMADGHRRTILNALCRSPMVAGELGRLVGLAPNAVSFHLKWLRSAGLVAARREGRYVRYHVEPDALADFRTHVDEQFAARRASASPAPRRPAPGIESGSHDAAPAAPGSEPRPPVADDVADIEVLPPELL